MATTTKYWCFPNVGDEVIVQMSDYDIHALIRGGQYELYLILWIHCAIQMIWAASTWLRGFGNLYDGSGFNAVSHIWLYMAWEILTLNWGFFAISFTFWVSERDGRLQKDSATIRWRISWWTFFLVVALLAHTFHIIATIYERHRCDSQLCTNNPGVMIGLIVGLATLIVIEVIELWRSNVYKRRLLKIARLRREVFDEQSEPQDPTPTTSSEMRMNEDINSINLTLIAPVRKGKRSNPSRRR